MIMFPLICGFHFHDFSCLQSIHGPKIKNVNWEIPEIIHFIKLCALLCNVMKSCAIWYHPAQDMNHVFVQNICAVYAAQLLSDRRSRYQCACVPITFILLNHGTKAQEN